MYLLCVCAFESRYNRFYNIDDYSANYLQAMNEMTI